ncbi:MAG: tRNA 2-thiouridine(34) synthase MnmA [Armatimonadetes bacterium]|nr:tRNA 2-thiouridine(34) synthase MnmA [Armatimonadota bacterium]
MPAEHTQDNRPCFGPVAVALSGGVDSTAALLRLMAAGLPVFGISADLHEPHRDNEGADRARALCARLGICFHRVDLREPFHKRVVEPFVAEYLAGRTPNPCVQCNEHIKFGLLLDAALELGARSLATGHYARLEHSPGRCPYLLMAADRHKDQSYVLHHLSSRQLGRALFPNGEYTRADNEALVAAELPDLPPAPQSQDACFLSGVDYADWLAATAPSQAAPGPIVDASGQVIGEHSGLWGYTVGQRKGLGIGGPGGRRFVLFVDVPRNRLVVGDEDDLWVHWCDLRDVNLIGCERDNPLECQVMTRYNGRLVAARVSLHAGGARVEFLEAARAPTPGQSAVFYRGEYCLGGGIICASELTDRYGGPDQSKE